MDNGDDGGGGGGGEGDGGGMAHQWRRTTGPPPSPRETTERKNSLKGFFDRSRGSRPTAEPRGLSCTVRRRDTKEEEDQTRGEAKGDHREMSQV